MGYVPEVSPFLAIGTVSLASLRFGGGMKGKIGEAMSFGLPAVTTSIGVEEFGLEPGKHVPVGDGPNAFAYAVIRLPGNRAYRESVCRAGWQSIRDNYSEWRCDSAFVLSSTSLIPSRSNVWDRFQPS